MSNTERIVDFVPEYDPNFDFKKISEYKTAKFNATLLPVYVVISMEQGSNQIYPEIGAKNLFMEIPFLEKDQVYEKIAQIQTAISNAVHNVVSVSLDDKTNWNTGEIYIKIEVSGCPAFLEVDVSKSGIFRVQSPSVYN